MARIVTVDDQASVRALIRRMLEAEGHIVFEAADGRELIDALPEDIDLVISDMLMPEADGLEVIKHVKRHHPDIPVLVVTGGWLNSGLDLREIARELGADQALSKTEIDQKLLRAVGELLRKRHQKARG